MPSSTLNCASAFSKQTLKAGRPCSAFPTALGELSSPESIAGGLRQAWQMSALLERRPGRGRANGGKSTCPHFIVKPFIPAEAPANMSPMLSCSLSARMSSSSNTLFETKSKPSNPFWSSALSGHCARMDIEVFM